MSRPAVSGRARSTSRALCTLALATVVSGAHSRVCAQGSAEMPPVGFPAPPAEQRTASFAVERSQRELVLPRGYVRASLGLTAGDSANGNRRDAYAWHDLGIALGLFDGFEVGVGGDRPGYPPRIGRSAISFGHDGDSFHYGQVPLYGRYQFVDTDVLMVAGDVEISFPTGRNGVGRGRGHVLGRAGDFGIRFSVPLRLRIENIAVDTGLVFDFQTDPGQANFSAPLILTVNLAPKFYGRVGVAFSVEDLFDRDSDFAYMPFFIGAGYTLDVVGHPLDVGGELGFPVLVSSRDDRTEGGIWFVRITAAMHFGVF